MITPLPRLLKRFQRQAEDFLAQKFVKEVDFSGGTYQVKITDPATKNDEWAFVQIDQQGRLKDIFCSCTESEDGHACVHQAAAFLYIYEGHDVPLHLRFEKSLWNHLCRDSASHIGVDADVMRLEGEGRYIYSSKGNSFSVQAVTPGAIVTLAKIFFQRPLETEETSLKFSNLSLEDIALWEKGRPSPQLAYELSFWYDLAKWMMELQDEDQPYTIEFEYNRKKLPKKISIVFPDVSFDWSLSEESLISIIPSLATVKSPLVVHSAWKEVIEKIIYDPERLCFVIVPRSHQEDLHGRLKKLKAVDAGDWAFVPNDGFYSKNPHFLLDVTESYDVEKLLDEHASAIKELLKGTIVKRTPSGVSYSISFDDAWNLHISCYLFSPGDLSQPGSHCFGSWAYVKERGFYRIEERDFGQLETIIPASEVSDFVSEHRPWLNTQKGFHTHLTTLEANLFYRFENNYLTFERQMEFPGEKMSTKDFGRWVYAKGQGFFSKVSTHIRLPVKAGTTVAPSQIPMFIRLNRDDLHFVKGFFSVKCPVVHSGIKIELLSEQRISVIPEHTLLPEYVDKEIKFFDDFVYVEGEGFSELPTDQRLPEGFNSAVVVEENSLPAFLSTQLEKLIPFASEVDPRLRKPVKANLMADEMEYHPSHGKDGYAMKLNYQTEFGAISLASLWWAFHQNQRYVFSDAGLFDLSDQRFNWLRGMAKNRVDRKRNMLTLPTLEILRLHALEGITATSAKNEKQQHSLQLFRDLTEFRMPEEPDLTGLLSHLRPYQLHGVRWLWFLYHHGLSGLLCDDMGLGKTHQSMALLMAIANEAKKSSEKTTKRHFLVVCPTSVIYHWQEKLAEFLPGLKVWTFYGANRSLEAFYEDCDILLTSYGIWRNEIDVLAKMPFEVAIFDELQIAKNHMSRIYRALLRSKARMRLGLTGTPIENRLRELKALFDIVLPTYLPAETEYRDLFVRPIEKEGNQEKKLLLSRLIKPFVLRRKKEDVLLDLPEKIEELSHCDLMPDQCNLYVEVLTKSREKLIEELQDESTPIPYLHIFTLLSHLKQICNHPAAYLKKPADYKQYQSGKWELFVELLEEARESNQKVVVFSQYLAMLDIIENYLQEQKVGYAAIRGKTINRGEQLQRFNSDPECEVFVASLQAVGLGVDLTAASVVIHYDRWWNAARENQATDRVHRIGQTRGVQVFKLMTKGTVEEHISFLISKKGRLMEDVVSADDHQVVKKFDRHEMIALLKIMPNAGK